MELNTSAIINDQFLSLNKWLTANKVKINVKKTKYVLYSYTGSLSFNQPIKMGGDTVYKTDIIKIFGRHT